MRPGDTLTGRVTVTDVQPSSTNPNRGTVFTTSEVLNQNGELVMTLKARGFFADATPRRLESARDHTPASSRQSRARAASSRA